MTRRGLKILTVNISAAPPLIFQISTDPGCCYLLQPTTASAGFGTILPERPLRGVPYGWLSRFHRACPSTSLDKSADCYSVIGKDITAKPPECQYVFGNIRIFIIAFWPAAGISAQSLSLFGSLTISLTRKTGYCAAMASNASSDACWSTGICGRAPGAIFR